MVWGEAAVVMSAPEKEIGPTAKSRLSHGKRILTRSSSLAAPKIECAGGMFWACHMSYIRYNSGGNPKSMAAPNVKEIFILGVTHSGRTFRPSDWAERLAGVMSPFRPGGAQNRHHPASYSPWCVQIGRAHV